MYPRMNKSDYPQLPEVINNDIEYDIVHEYLIMVGTHIENFQQELTYPLLPFDKQQELKKKISVGMKKYDELCDMMDNYIYN